RSVLPFGLTVAAIEDGAPPRLVVEIPVEGVTQAGGDGDRRVVIELSGQLAAINRVAAVMPRPVGHEFDAARARFSGCRPTSREPCMKARIDPKALVSDRTEVAHQVDVLAFRAAADVVNLPHPAD